MRAGDVRGDGHGSADDDSTPRAGYRFDVAVGTPVAALEARTVFSADVLPRHSHAQRLARRVFDVTAGAVALCVAVPLLAVVALAVKVSSRGPCLFVQERVGLHGEPFFVYKFRTMRVGTHEDVLGDVRQATRYRENGFKLPPDDPHITRVGRWLRASSLDELPQLVNVVRGEMSLVGVRPVLAEELSLRSTYDQALYGMMRPGMTGLWQVEGRSSVQEADRHALDRRYVEDWTWAGDLRLLARTPSAVARAADAV